MKLAFLDFETFWSPTHSLSKMSPIEYVMHPETELISCSLEYDGAPVQVAFGEASIRNMLAQVDWTDTYAIAHNMSGFDAMLLAWRLGIKPAMWGCTLAMARPIHAKTTGLGLGKLVAHYAEELAAMGIKPIKDQTILVNTKGKHLADFSAAELASMRVYNADDTSQCRGLFHILKGHFSASELWHLDCNIRMLVDPEFVVDRELLGVALSAERDQKTKNIMDLIRLLEMSNAGTEMPWDDPEALEECVRAHLASAPKFSWLLKQRGVEVPTKPSPTNKGVMIPALAKTDQAFLDLQEHDDPLVAAAARARLSEKSTLLETRICAFIDASEAVGGRLPVPLNYCGADTSGRDSGWLYNPQNMPRIGKKPKVSDALRNSLRAPPGYLIGVADQAGIEMRVNHFLWKVPSTMALYASSPDKADLYRSFAGKELYRIPEDQVDDAQRQIGKVAQLGLGFGAGAATFQRIAKTMGGVNMPLDKGPPPDEWFDPDGYPLPHAVAAYEQWRDTVDCKTVVNAWRSAYQPIAAGWTTCGGSLEYIQKGVKREVDPWGFVTTCAEGLRLPSGRLIRYPDLRIEDDGYWPDGRQKRSWVYSHGRHKAYLTGPKVDENIVQALARDSVFECALRFFRLTRLRPILRVHDELIYMFPESEAQDLIALLQKTMRTPPSWWSELVVWSAGGLGATYGSAKH